MKQIICASLVSMIVLTGCERSVDGLSAPGLSENPNVYIDGFSAGLEYYPFADSKQTAFSVDTETSYDKSPSSMRFDVPNAGDPGGPYAGAIFRDENGGRDLSSYNALTFYTKATKAATINDVGFGQDFGENKYQVNISGLRVATNWQKVIIPIPDASKLTQEQGMFWYAEGPDEVTGDGYTFWVDDLKFENLTGIAQPRASIMNGNDVSLTSFIGSGTTVSGLAFTINQANGQDVTVNASSSYFEFTSSDPSVATVDENGQVEVLTAGTTEIKATLGGIDASGGITVESIGDFTFAPNPTFAATDVISIFSDTYENVPVDFYNGFYAPFQTTTSNDFEVNGNNVLGYDNFNFVGIEFNQSVSTINGNEMTNLKMDVYFPDAVPSGSALRLTLRDFGASGTFGGDDDTIAEVTIRPPALVAGQWVTLDLNIAGMAGKSNLGQIVLDADLGTNLRGSGFYVDNIYLHK